MGRSSVENSVPLENVDSGDLLHTGRSNKIEADQYDILKPRLNARLEDTGVLDNRKYGPI